jgi:hypothetical protein
MAHRQDARELLNKRLDCRGAHLYAIEPPHCLFGRGT